jgi:oxygen-independent coproporphyrinogen-3 oxidase
MNLPSTTSRPTLGIYGQVPFCASKCTFCNFSSGVERSTILGQYTQMLWRELERWPEIFRASGIPTEVMSLSVDSVYFGGGTPALLGEESLRSIVRGLREHLRWSEDVEFTLETTPGSVSTRLLEVLRWIGVNRLSIGAQTFDDGELRAVGRLHSAEETIELVQAGRRAGFGNISLDLIAGLPYQTGASFQHSLEVTAKLRPEHVSLYLFEVDEKSRLGKQVIHGGRLYHASAVPDDEFVADAYDSGCDFLAKAGYIQYEISNFALPGYESRHNRKYWQLAPYLGLGAGAHSFDGARRWSNQTNVQGYLASLDSGQSPIEECRVLSVGEQVEEFFFLGLRQAEGVNLEWAREHWGADAIRNWEGKIERLAREGWVDHHDGRVRLARRAYLVSNEIFQEFVSA